MNPDASTAQTTTPSQLSDEELLARYEAGRDEAAFAELVARYQHTLYRIAFAQCGRTELAEEIVQEVFLRLAREGSVKAFQNYPSFRIWFCSVTANVARFGTRSETRYRRRARSKRYQDEAKTMSETRRAHAAPPAAAEETSRILTDVLGELEADLRVPIILHFMEGMSQQEIGSVAGVAQSTVARRIQEGLEFLRRRMAARGVTASAVALPGLLQQGNLLAPSAALQKRLSPGNLLKRGGERASLRAAAPAANHAWLLVTTLLVATAAGGASWYLTSSARAPEAATAVRPAAAPDPATSVPLHRRWSFARGPADDLEGDWTWVPAEAHRPAGMRSATAEHTIVRLPVGLAEGKCWAVTIRGMVQTPRLNVYFNARAEWVKTPGYYRTWGSSGAIASHARVYTRSYLIDDWEIVTYWVRPRDTFLSAVVTKIEGPRGPLVVCLRNYLAEEIELREVTKDDIPERFRDPERLIAEANLHPRPLDWGAPIAQTGGTQPLVRRWSFDAGPHQDLAHASGAWQWAPATESLPAGMRTAPDAQTIVRIPVEIDSDACWAIRVLGHPLSGQGFSLRAELGKPLGASYTTWRSALRSTVKSSHWTHTYLAGDWEIVAYWKDTADALNGVVVNRRDGPPGDLFLVAQNYVVQAIEVKAITRAEIPERFRDPEKLVADMKLQPKRCVAETPAEDLTKSE